MLNSVGVVAQGPVAVPIGPVLAGAVLELLDTLTVVLMLEEPVLCCVLEEVVVKIYSIKEKVAGVVDKLDSTTFSEVVTRIELVESEVVVGVVEELDASSFSEDVIRIGSVESEVVVGVVEELDSAMFSEVVIRIESVESEVVVGIVEELDVNSFSEITAEVLSSIIENQVCRALDEVSAGAGSTDVEVIGVVEELDVDVRSAISTDEFF
jgi:hypothetical protein